MTAQEARQAPFDHYWRLHVRLGDRFGHACRVTARGRMNSIEIEFEDGVRHIVGRYSVRKKKGAGEPAP